MITKQMIADFHARGGTITKLATGASTGITKNQWDRLVRGEDEPVEVPALIDAFVEKQAKKPLRLRAGYGEVR